MALSDGGEADQQDRPPAEPMQVEAARGNSSVVGGGDGDAQAAKRRRLEELRGADAIMEPGVLDRVAAYLEAGGQPAEVVEALSDGYVGAFSPRAGCAPANPPSPRPRSRHAKRTLPPQNKPTGYAQMASLVCDWLGMLASASESSSAAAAAAEAAATRAGSASAAAVAAATAPAPSAPPPPPASSTADEFDLLSELVLARFDPSAVSRAAEEAAAADPEGAAGPAAADPDAALAALCDGGGARGRAVLLQLLLRQRQRQHQHQNHDQATPLLGPRPCPPLGRAIERMLERGGRAAEAEVAATSGASAALASLYFGAYERLVCGRLAAFAEAAAASAAKGGSTRRECEALCRELRATCCGSLHAYLLAQALVSRAAEEAGGSNNNVVSGALRRLGQELEIEAAARHGAGSVWPLRRMYARGGSVGEVEATALVGEVLAAAGEWRPPGGGGGGGGARFGWAAGEQEEDGDAGGGGGDDDRARSRTPPPVAPPPPIQRAARALQRLVELYGRGGGGDDPHHRPFAADADAGAASLQSPSPAPPPRHPGGGGGGGSTSLLSPEPLRHPEMLELLLAALFSATPSAPAASTELRACRRLLALALASSSSSSSSSPTPEELEPAIEAAAALATRCSAQGPGAGQGKPRPGARDFAAAERAAAASPALALAIARVARAALASPATYADDRCALSAAALLELLRICLRAHPELCGALAVEAVDASLRASARTGRGLEVGRLALALLLEVVVTAASVAESASSSSSFNQPAAMARLGQPALDLAVRWAAQAEAGAPLLRQFALALLGCASPPYSPAFARGALRLVLAARLVGRSTAAFGGGGGGGVGIGGGGGSGGSGLITPQQREMLAAFVRECRSMDQAARRRGAPASALPILTGGADEAAAFRDLCRGLGLVS